MDIPLETDILAGRAPSLLPGTQVVLYLPIAGRVMIN